MANPVPNAQPTLAITQAVNTQGAFPSRPDGDQSINPGASGGDYLGQINLYAFDPSYFTTTAQGQTLSISQQNVALFSLYGTTFGGNGQTTFALPNLVGVVTAGTGQGTGLPSVDLGSTLGESGHVLTRDQTARRPAAPPSRSTRTSLRWASAITSTSAARFRPTTCEWGRTRSGSSLQPATISRRRARPFAMAES